MSIVNINNQQRNIHVITSPPAAERHKQKSQANFFFLFRTSFLSLKQESKKK